MCDLGSEERRQIRAHHCAWRRSSMLTRCRVRLPVVRAISKRVYRHIAQTCCPWNAKFSQALAEESPFRAREFFAGNDARTLEQDILELNQCVGKIPGRVRDRDSRGRGTRALDAIGVFDRDRNPMQRITWFAIALGVICLVCLRERLSLVESHDGGVRGVLLSSVREKSLYHLPSIRLTSADHFGERAGWKNIEGWFHGFSINTGRAPS